MTPRNPIPKPTLLTGTPTDDPHPAPHKSLCYNPAAQPAAQRARLMSEPADDDSPRDPRSDAPPSRTRLSWSPRARGSSACTFGIALARGRTL
jgi:hypothetical protein